MTDKENVEELKEKLLAAKQAEKEKEKLEKLQEDMQELESSADEIGQHINCAGSCEDLNDFFDNIAQALETAESIVKELKKIQKKDTGV